MTSAPSQPNAPKAKAAAAVAAAKAAAARAPSPFKKLDAQEEADMRDEKVATGRFRRMKIQVTFQTWLIGALALALVVLLPFAQPVYYYYAMNPDKKLVQMHGLTMSNMTNQAILSWSTTSITEIMTIGFGDLDTKIPKQKIRFTKNGWNSYIKAFINEGIGAAFKQHQLVLTTVPANTPVILWQGINEEGVYEWVVQMPIIMTYATNGDVTAQKRSVVTLTIMRVPVEDNPWGIAISNWH